MGLFAAVGAALLARAPASRATPARSTQGPAPATALRSAQTADAGAGPSAALPLAAPSLPVVRYTLPNGLEVLLHEDHRSATVAVNVWYHVGGKDEPQGRNGFAHLFEHLMFQGSRHVAEDTYFLNLERAGASNINGTTADDRTNYFETVPSGRLNLALWLESDRMGFLLDHVDQATFESQRRVVLNEYRQSYENAPYGMVYKFVREALYPVAHPYHRLPIGTPEDLNAATLEDVRRFFHTWYVPNNATLCIAGDIDVAQTRAMVEQYFGPIARGRDVPRQPPPGAVQLTGEQRLAVEAGVELPRLSIAWPTPAYLTADDASLDLVASVLATGQSSRLYRRLVRDMQIAQDVEAEQASTQLGSAFWINVTARPGHTPEELLRVVDEELARVRAEAPSAEELTRARNVFLSHLFFATERVAMRADRFNAYNQHLGDPDFFARDLARYQNQTVALLQNAAREFLPLDRRVVALIYPTPGAPIAGRLRGGNAAAPTPAPGANAPTAAPRAQENH